MEKCVARQRGRPPAGVRGLFVSQHYLQTNLRLPVHAKALLAQVAEELDCSQGDAVWLLLRHWLESRSRGARNDTMTDPMEQLLDQVQLANRQVAARVAEQRQSRASLLTELSQELRKRGVELRELAVFPALQLFAHVEDETSHAILESLKCIGNVLSAQIVTSAAQSTGPGR